MFHRFREPFGKHLISCSFITTDGVAAIGFKEVVHETKRIPRSVHVPKPRELKDKPDTKQDEVIFDIKKARHEVFNFGVGGFEAPEKAKAKVMMAVKLGAKPPKQPYRNYKEILAEKKAIAQTSVKDKSITSRESGKTASGEVLTTFRKFNNKRMRRKMKAENEDALRDYGKVTTSGNK